MTARNIQLDILVRGTRVGSLRGGPQGRVRFSVDNEWLRDGQQPRLGWPFLVDPSPRDGGLKLPAWFENLLPELGSPLRRRVCAEHNLGDYDGPGLLGALGGDLPGAVEVRGWVDPLADGDEESDDDRGLGAGERLRFSVAGMQPKLSMLQNAAGRWVLPATNESGSWYVKFEPMGLPGLAQVEHTTMSWAASCGLTVPPHRLVALGDLEDVESSFMGQADQAFAIERFDRVEGRRVHQEDLAQALEIYPYDKYGGPGRLAVSYDSLARFFSDACGAADQREYFQRVAFMLASGNDDAHLKNWSIQWSGDDERAHLSPCYDQVCTIAWPEFGWHNDNEPSLALPFAGRKSLVDLDRARLETFSERAKATDAGQVIVDTLVRARDSWATHVNDAPPSMRDALREHWQRVPLLASLGPLVA